MIHVLIFWHMHQPYYKDLITGEYRLPWTRMHALKDYYGMAAMMEEFPQVRVNFNMVPSLVEQIQEYAAGKARDPVLEIAFKPAAALVRDEKLRALNWLFQANRDRMIFRYPRYKQLWSVWHTAGHVAEKTLPLFTGQDFADLQVLSQVAWFDEIYLQSDPVIQDLVRKGRGYTATDQQALHKKHQELLGKVLEAYRAAQDRGQAELTTSPFYHPILPLICDTETSAEAHPGGRLPRRFRHPEDARLQLERAITLHEEVFGRRPHGIWPSEGSVSDQALGLAAELGIRWAATDEGVLARTLGHGFPRDAHGVPTGGDSLYRGYDVSTPAGPVRLFFRDHQFSDLVGFVYANMDPGAAAADLLARIRRAAAGLHDPVVPIILDGENCWEYYHESGREFLRRLYRGLAESSDLRTVTGSQAAAEFPARSTISHVVPGSWINANFDIWIGSPDDHRAWNLLSDARDYYAAHAEQATPAQRELALEELLIAEGSDWCWWYGPEHHSHNDADFDQLYRAHLSNVYRALGASAPLELAAPITSVVERVFHAPPRCYLHPRVDGRVSNYFEWLGAGLYSPDHSTSTMHGHRPFIDHLHYALDAENFYLRLDFFSGTLAALVESKAEVHVTLSAGAALLELLVHLGKPCVPSPGMESATGSIFELRAGLGPLGLLGAPRLQFHVVLRQDGLPVDRLPSAGSLDVETANPQ